MSAGVPPSRSSSRWRSTRNSSALLWVLAFQLASACERASFESLGIRRDTAPSPILDGPNAAPNGVASDPGGSSAIAADAGLAVPPADANGSAAGSGGASGMQPAADSGGVGGGAGAVIGADLSGALMGSFPGRTFEAVKAGFVVGRSDELGTTTAYLIDHPVTCAEISKFAWLAGLGADVQVIELMFPTTAKTGSPITGSIVSYAQGGMYSLSKMRASTRMLVLSRNEQGGVVEGRLEATFSSGHLNGTFQTEFCATGMSF